MLVYQTTKKHFSEHVKLNQIETEVLSRFEEKLQKDYQHREWEWWAR